MKKHDFFRCAIKQIRSHLRVITRVHSHSHAASDGAMYEREIDEMNEIKMRYKRNKLRTNEHDYRAVPLSNASFVACVCAP